MSTQTVYLALLAMLFWGGWLILIGLRHSPARLPLMATLVVICGVAAWQAPWLARTVSGDPAQKAITKLHSIYEDPDSKAGEFMRLVAEIDPGAMEYFEQAARDAMAEPDPQAYLEQRAMEYGLSLGPQLVGRLLSGSDEDYQELLTIMAPVAKGLPADDTACLALLRGGDADALNQLVRQHGQLDDRLLDLLVRMLRDGRQSTPVQPTPAQFADFNRAMADWVGQLSAADINFIMKMGAAPPDLNTMGGPICRVIKSLIGFLADKPAPEGGRLLRLMLLAGSQPA